MNLYIDGCSYSSYYWPSWADLLAMSNSDSYNIAESGAGNERIFLNMMHNLPKFIPGKTKVILQWSSWPRFDHWKPNTFPWRWDAAGNRYYVGDFIEKNSAWWDDDYLKFKTYHYVKAAAAVLESANIEYYFLTMDNWSKYKTAKTPYDWHSLITHPKMILHDINDYMANKKFNCYSYFAPWESKVVPDGHPTVEAHLSIANHVNRYLNLNIDQTLSDDFSNIHKKITENESLEEIKKFSKSYKRSDRYLNTRSLMTSLCNSQ